MGRAVLDYFGIPGADDRAIAYAACKQPHLVRLIETEKFTPFPDALRFVQALKTRGFRLAAASVLIEERERTSGRDQRRHSGIGRDAPESLGR